MARDDQLAVYREVLEPNQPVQGGIARGAVPVEHCDQLCQVAAHMRLHFMPQTGSDLLRLAKRAQFHKDGLHKTQIPVEVFLVDMTVIQGSTLEALVPEHPLVAEECMPRFDALAEPVAAA